ncbi:MAG: aminoacyl-tRNA hydrolase [Candidatus Howiella sp.]
MIVGLGNPGEKYESTRHNAGFMAVEGLASRYGCRLKKLKCKMLYGDCVIEGRKVLLCEPQTYMNNSGEAVRDLSAFYKLPPERVILLVDDISLDVGRIRIRRKGSDGGHNGLKSIFYLCGSDAFPRVKIGVGAKPSPDYDLADWVLSRFRPEETEPLRGALETAGKAAALIAQGEIDRAMNLYSK